jgi:hypothetical protein
MPTGHLAGVGKGGRAAKIPTSQVGIFHDL